MFGAIWAWFGAEAAFIFSAAISIVAAVLLFTVKLEQAHAETRP